MNSISHIICFIVLIMFEGYTIAQEIKSDWEVFPIVNYDTDAGFGYGAKAYYYNLFEHKESLDLILFNSTKGERWYRFVLSIPDAQRRLGKKYNFALDLIVDYDKWINYNFYYDTYSDFKNIDSLNSTDFETYIREPIELQVKLSHAFTSQIITELELKFKSISCFNFSPSGQLRFIGPSQTQFVSLLFGLLYDSRSEFVNPNEGIVLKLTNELAQDIFNRNKNYYELEFTLHSYNQIFLKDLTLASRIILKTQSDTPYQNNLGIGGNKTLRGLPQDRYLSNSFFLLNEELRFRIWWRVGGILGLDIGNSRSTPQIILNPVIGARFYMDNFVVRADVGFGKETTGFYFNFDHLF